MYVQFEKEMEDPKGKKKEVWAKVTTSMLKQGHIYSQGQIENKWRNMMKSQKAMGDNKKETGSMRKSFEYYQRDMI